MIIITRKLGLRFLGIVFEEKRERIISEMTTGLGFSRNYGVTESASFRIPAFEYIIFILGLIGGVRNLKLSFNNSR